MTTVQKYAGADWLAGALQMRNEPAPAQLGRDVADILGVAFCGIYHIPGQTLFHARTKWDDPRLIELVTSRSLSTYDFAELSDLVFSCIQRRVRLEVRGVANGYLRLTFLRDTEMETSFTRHPEPAAFIASLVARTAP